MQKIFIIIIGLCIGRFIGIAIENSNFENIKFILLILISSSILFLISTYLKSIEPVTKSSTK